MANAGNETWNRKSGSGRHNVNVTVCVSVATTDWISPVYTPLHSSAGTDRDVPSNVAIFTGAGTAVGSAGVDSVAAGVGSVTGAVSGAVGKLQAESNKIMRREREDLMFNVVYP
jgi:hypothetical protein